MQNFLREQPYSRKPINFIIFVADLFEKYSKIMNENNSPLGEKLLDFLIEAIQGPCLDNQKEVCQKTRILEVLEEVNLKLRSNTVKINEMESAYSNFRLKIILL
jgi:inositol 1,4,5-triphosphate receptor type 3